MWELLFLITTIVFAVKCYANNIVLKAMIYYIVDKGYTAPTGREMKQCIDIVVKKNVDKWFRK